MVRGETEHRLERDNRARDCRNARQQSVRGIQICVHQQNVGNKKTADRKKLKTGSDIGRNARGRHATGNQQALLAAGAHLPLSASPLPILQYLWTYIHYAILAIH